jgi:hypothetical protein
MGAFQFWGNLLMVRWPGELRLCRRHPHLDGGGRLLAAGLKPDLSRPGTQKSAPILKRTLCESQIFSAC